MYNKNVETLLICIEMKRLTVPLLLLSVLLVYLLPACDGLEDHYSTNPNHRLSFSADTLSFDTVFSTIGSATQQFLIYNNNSEPLNMSSIMLASGGTSGFRINVDGRKGYSFSDIGILNQDSMFVFVEVTVNPTQKDQPLLIQDSVVFITNGIKQSVLLEAYGQDVKLYKGGATITQDTVLTAERPYLIYDSLVIARGAHVNIEKGATFYMHDKANIINYGSINAAGTQERPITFRGDRLDFILNDLLPYDRTPGQWGGIYFRPESYNNIMNYTIVRNGITGLTFDESLPDQSKLKINNSQITNMSENLLFARNCNIEATNSEFSNAALGVVMLIGGTYQFSHCTIANYMTLISRSVSPVFEQELYTACLTLSNNVEVNKVANHIPLQQAHFDNCIIDGNFSAGGTQPYGGEIALLSTGSTAFNYKFNHCLIKTTGKDNEHFSNIVFRGDKDESLYRMTGGEKNKYKLDFRLDKATSLGVGKADATISQKYPVDRYGVDRLTSTNGPSIGAYEFVAKEESK